MKNINKEFTRVILIVGITIILGFVISFIGALTMQSSVAYYNSIANVYNETVNDYNSVLEYSSIDYLDTVETDYKQIDILETGPFSFFRNITKGVNCFNITNKQKEVENLYNQVVEDYELLQLVTDPDLEVIIEKIEGINSILTTTIDNNTITFTTASTNGSVEVFSSTKDMGELSDHQYAIGTILISFEQTTSKQIEEALLVEIITSLTKQKEKQVDYQKLFQEICDDFGINYDSYKDSFSNDMILYIYEHQSEGTLSEIFKGFIRENAPQLVYEAMDHFINTMPDNQKGLCWVNYYPSSERYILKIYIKEEANENPYSNIAIELAYDDAEHEWVYTAIDVPQDGDIVDMDEFYQLSYNLFSYYTYAIVDADDFAGLYQDLEDSDYIFEKTYRILRGTLSNGVEYVELEMN